MSARWSGSSGAVGKCNEVHVDRGEGNATSIKLVDVSLDATIGVGKDAVCREHSLGLSK